MTGVRANPACPGVVPSELGRLPAFGSSQIAPEPGPACPPARSGDRFPVDSGRASCGSSRPIAAPIHAGATRLLCPAVQFASARSRVRVRRRSTARAALLDSLGLDESGLDLADLDWSGLDWSGFDSPGLVRVWQRQTLCRDGFQLDRRKSRERQKAECRL